MNNQDIVDNAPEGATHWDIEYGFYWMMDRHSTQVFSALDNKFKEEKLSSDFLRSLADIKRIAELEKRLVAPTDSGVVELDVICEKFNNNNNSNLCDLTSSIWNKAYFEALKEQGK